MPLSGFAEPPAMIPAGNLVLLTAPGHLICTLLDERLPSQSGLIKRAEDLPKLVTALRQLSACVSAARSRAEEWGEHVVSGLGELHGDPAAELALSQGPESRWVSCFKSESSMLQVYSAATVCSVMMSSSCEGPVMSCQRWSSYMTSRSM